MYLLHTYPDRFVLDVDGGLSTSSLSAGGDAATGGVPESLLIDRATGAITRAKGQLRAPHGAAYSERIDGILGIITSGHVDEGREIHPRCLAACLRFVRH